MAAVSEPFHHLTGEKELGRCAINNTSAEIVTIYAVSIISHNTHKMGHIFQFYLLFTYV